MNLDYQKLNILEKFHFYLLIIFSKNKVKKMGGSQSKKEIIKASPQNVAKNSEPQVINYMENDDVRAHAAQTGLDPALVAYALQKQDKTEEVQITQ